MRRGFGEFVVLGTIALIVYLAADALGLFNTNISTNLPKPRYTPVFEPIIPNVPPLWENIKTVQNETVASQISANNTSLEETTGVVESSEGSTENVSESEVYINTSSVKNKESETHYSYLASVILQACKEKKCDSIICDAVKRIGEPLSVELHIGRQGDYWWRYNFGDIVVDERYINNNRVLVVWYISGGAARSCVIAEQSKERS